MTKDKEEIVAKFKEVLRESATRVIPDELSSEDRKKFSKEFQKGYDLAVSLSKLKLDTVIFSVDAAERHARTFLGM